VIATSRTLQSIQDLPAHVNVTLPLDTKHRPIDISADLHLMELDVNWDTLAIHTAIEKALGIYGRIDVLVNNAGYAFKNIVEDVE